jgi:hypothetical protein
VFDLSGIFQESHPDIKQEQPVLLLVNVVILKEVQVKTVVINTATQLYKV